MKGLLMVLLVLHFQSAVATSDDALAQRLMLEQRYSEAAAVFSQPLWQGIALYRGEQWAAAAEAFAMSADPMARYNLGNCYAQLGHYALALETFNHVQRDHPDFERASANARLMRALLEKSEDEKGQAPNPQTENGPSPDSEQDEPESQGDQAEPTSESGDKPETRQGEASSELKNGQLAEEESPPAEQAPVPASSGKDDPSDDASQTDFMASRNAEEQQQTEQWLSSIEDRPSRFLKARIELEMRRRAAAGSLSQGAEAPW